jgi:flagellar hook-length control protein FliK
VLQVRICLMSVQPLPSVPVASESGAARMRPAGTERARGHEPFALPEQGASARREATNPAMAREGRGIDARNREPNSGKLPPERAEAGISAGDPVMPESGPAVAVQPPAVLTPSVPVIQGGAAQAAALPAATLPVEVLAVEQGVAAEPSLGSTGEASAAVAVVPTQEAVSVPEPAPAPALADASNFVLFAALATSEAKSAAAVPSAAEPAPAVAGAIATAGSASGVSIQTTATPVQPGAVLAATGTPTPEASRAGMLPLPGVASDAADGDPVSTAKPDAEAMQLAARLAGLGVEEGVAKGGAKDGASRPEFKIPEALQPAQGAIEFAPVAHVRPLTADGLQATQLVAQPNVSAQAATTSQPTPLHVVPIEIGLRALAGGRNFDIRLDPAELGRVDVSLKISDEGEVTAKLVVDRVETLHLLQRDARTLERAFEQAGLKPSNAGVDISLRDPGDQSGFRQQQREQDEAPRRAPPLTDIPEDAGLGLHPVQSATVRGLIRLGGVDLSI